MREYRESYLIRSLIPNLFLSCKAEKKAGSKKGKCNVPCFRFFSRHFVRGGGPNYRHDYRGFGRKSLRQVPIEPVKTLGTQVSICTDSTNIRTLIP